MNEKKTVLSVILGLSLFSLITGVIGLIVEGMILLFGSCGDWYVFSNRLLGAFMLGAAVITIVFLALYIVKRKTVLAIIVPAVILTVFAIAVSIIVSIDDVIVYGQNDAVYVSFIAAIVTLAVTVILTVVTTLWLKAMKAPEKTDESVKPDEPKA